MGKPTVSLKVKRRAVRTAKPITQRHPEIKDPKLTPRALCTSPMVLREAAFSILPNESREEPESRLRLLVGCCRCAQLRRPVVPHDFIFVEDRLRKGHAHGKPGPAADLGVGGLCQGSLCRK